MTSRALIMAAATARQLTIAPFSAPAMPPANLLTGRFVWEVAAKGYGYPNVPADESVYGLSLWDWNNATGMYEMTNFATHGNYITDYSTGGAGSGVICFATATSVILAGLYEISADTKVSRALIAIGVAPSAAITFQTPATYAYDDPVNYVPPFNKSIGVAYSGNVLYSLSGYPTASTYAATNGWVQKVSASTAAKNATALRSGLPTDSSQGKPGARLAALGGAAANGYVVVNVDDRITNATCRYQLVNCTGTPVAVGTQLSYAGNCFAGSDLLPIGASAVVAPDFYNAAGRGRVSLLTTNSATAPTTLSKGAEALLPAPPDFPLADLANAKVALFHACWFTEGKTITWVEWISQSTGNHYLRPMIISSTGPTNISVSLPATDMNGLTSPVVDGQSKCGHIVAAPGGKAVLLVPTTGGEIKQYVYQL